MTAHTNLYSGFSTFEFQKSKSLRLTDVEAVKMDLLNHIFTRKGERVMLPGFGTLIPDLVFEPLDDELIETLEDELEAVVEYDPRTELISIETTPAYDNNTVVVAIKVRYIELNITEAIDLQLTFEGA